MSRRLTCISTLLPLLSGLIQMGGGRGSPPPQAIHKFINYKVNGESTERGNAGAENINLQIQ